MNIKIHEEVYRLLFSARAESLATRDRLLAFYVTVVSLFLSFHEKLRNYETGIVIIFLLSTLSVYTVLSLVQFRKSHIIYMNQITLIFNLWQQEKEINLENINLFSQLIIRKKGVSNVLSLSSRFFLIFFISLLMTFIPIYIFLDIFIEENVFLKIVGFLIYCILILLKARKEWMNGEKYFYKDTWLFKTLLER